MSEFQPRPAQKEVLEYSGGKLGVSAVPGSGKTHTLAALAARLVATRIDDGQEVLVVTLVNSAVDNFKQRINWFIAGRHLLPGYGYRVRTLHGLSHDIVRERPGLVDLSEDFGIIDEREAAAIRTDAVESWLRAHPDAADRFLSADLEGSRAEWIKTSRWPALVQDVAAAFIKRAKDQQLVPEALMSALSAVPDPFSFELARMGTEIYAAYQRSLAYRGAVDFDDLIRLALLALTRDAEYLARLRDRWPFILEDEAQDSSELQEKILRRLVGEQGNWVRVGDPNQAIYDTFTNANPRFLRDYLQEKDVVSIPLRESGRSQPAIIDLANYLVDWAVRQDYNTSARGALVPLHIEPTGPGDPQPNPSAGPAAVQLVDRDMTPDQELQVVVDSLQRWLPDHAGRSVAVLVPRNHRGFELIELLKKRDIPYVELLRSTSVTRETAGALGNILRCLADPTSARKLSVAFKVWRRDGREDPEVQAATEAAARSIAACPAVEAYLWPRADHDWLAPLAAERPAAELELLTGFRDVACRWLKASILPIDQLVITLAADLFQRPAELALAYKLAALLRDTASSHPGFRLPELVEELAVIARNERRFLGFSSEDTGFEPPQGQVTVATMHKAKGLEWDRVYLLSVNNYNFPIGLAHDTYIAERWFVRDHLNLEAEALAQLAAIAASRAGSEVAEPAVSIPAPPEGDATRRARLDYICERLRLYYVGITRARRDLVVTWNTGRGRDKLQPSVPFLALHDYWEQHRHEPTE